MWNEKITFVESSCILVCSAINRTQKQLRCTFGGHFEWEKAGLFNIGLFIPEFPISKSGTAVKSSELEWVSWGNGPCTWQLPPKGPVLVRLNFKYISHSSFKTTIPLIFIKYFTNHSLHFIILKQKIKYLKNNQLNNLPWCC